MKKITLIVALLISTSLFAQTQKHESTNVGKQRLDSLVTPGMQKFAFDYDNNGNLITENQYMWGGSAWTPTLQISSTYDGNGNLTKESSRLWDNGTWTPPLAEITYTYDNNGNLTEKTSENPGGKSKIEYEYDNHENLTTETHYEWKNDGWEATEKFEYTYTNGNLMEKINYKWDGTWDLFAKDEFEYDNGGNQLLITSYLWDNGWIVSRKTEFTRKSNGYPLTSNAYTWDEGNSVWENQLKSEYTYDDNENLETQNTFWWFFGSWFPSGNFSYTYDLSYSNSDIIAPSRIKQEVYWTLSNNKAIESASSFSTTTLYYSTITEAPIYHNDDKEGLRAFLRQPSAWSGKINAQLLGLEISDTLNWQTQEEWVEKVEGLTWDLENPFFSSIAKIEKTTRSKGERTSIINFDRGALKSKQSKDLPKRLTTIGLDNEWFNLGLAGHLDCTKWPELWFLICIGNKWNDDGEPTNMLTSIDVGNNPNLLALYVNNNLLTALDVSGCPFLVEMWLDNNQLTTLDVSNNPILMSLWVPENQLTTLTLGPSLIELVTCDNLLTTLDLSNSPDLESVLCHENSLTSLDVSNNPNLIELSADLNYFLFSTIPTEILSMEIYYIAPQKTISGGEVNYQAGIDLTAEYSIEGNTTQFSWFEVIGSNEQPITLSNTNGLFSLTENHIGKRLRCKMTNATFPDFKDNNVLVYEVVITGTPSGIAAFQTANLKLYPNPTTDKFFIEYGDLKQPVIKIYNVSGQEVLNQTIPANSEINVSHLQNGVYNVVVLSEGKVVGNSKIVKK
jgi:hypothetical protein